VTAVDIDTVLLELIPAQNRTVRQMDVRTSELPAGAYDLVTCRALPHQIAEDAPAVLETLPGMVGKLGLGRPQAKTDVQNIRGRDRGRCTSGCSSLRCAIVSLTVDGSTRQRSTLPRGCWTTRITGPSAG
jgi:hypothetical protein